MDKNVKTREDQGNHTNDLSVLAESIDKTHSSFIRLNAGMQRVEDAQKTEVKTLKDIAAAIRKLNENIVVLDKRLAGAAKSLESKLDEAVKRKELADQLKKLAEEGSTRIPILNMRVKTASVLQWMQILLLLSILLRLIRN